MLYDGIPGVQQLLVDRKEAKGRSYFMWHLVIIIDTINKLSAVRKSNQNTSIIARRETVHKPYGTRLQEEQWSQSIIENAPTFRSTILASTVDRVPVYLLLATIPVYQSSGVPNGGGVQHGVARQRTVLFKC